MTREEALQRVEGYLTDCLPMEASDEIEAIMKALRQDKDYLQEITSSIFEEYMKVTIGDSHETN
jgi:hypothetical protein